MNRICFLIFLITLPLVPWQAAQGYDWNNDYGVDLRVGQENNFRLAESNEIDTTSTRLGLFANLQASTEISRIGISLGANSVTYSESEIDDSDGYNLSLDASRRGERFSGSLILSAAIESTTDTEPLDTGNVVDGERESTTAAPRLNFQVNQRQSLFAGLSARDVTYDTDFLIDYTNNSASFGWLYSLGETSTISLTLSASEYDPEDDDSTTTDSVSLAYEGRISELTGYSVAVGYSNVDRPRDSESSGDYTVSINHQGDERNSFEVVLSNGFTASGTGNVRDQDNLSMTWRHSLSDRSRLSLASDATSSDERNYVSISLGGSYQYLPEISLGASLRFRRQESDTVDADSSSVFFTLSYSPL